MSYREFNSSVLRWGMAGRAVRRATFRDLFMQAAPVSLTYAPHAESRCAERFETVLAVAALGLDGWTRNISSTGLCFETAALPTGDSLAGLKAGALVQMKIELLLEGERHDLSCQGKILRVDWRARGIVVATQLLTPFFAGMGNGQGHGQVQVQAHARTRCGAPAGRPGRLP